MQTRLQKPECHNSRSFVKPECHNLRSFVKPECHNSRSSVETSVCVSALQLAVIESIHPLRGCCMLTGWQVSPMISAVRLQCEPHIHGSTWRSGLSNIRQMHHEFQWTWRTRRNLFHLERTRSSWNVIQTCNTSFMQQLIGSMSFDRALLVRYKEMCCLSRFTLTVRTNMKVWCITSSIPSKISYQPPHIILQLLWSLQSSSCFCLHASRMDNYGVSATGGSLA